MGSRFEQAAPFALRELQLHQQAEWQAVPRGAGAQFVRGGLTVEERGGGVWDPKKIVCAAY